MLALMESDIALKLALAVFMSGSLLEMGLRLPVARALAGLRAPLLLTYGGIFGFALGPAFALLIAHVMGIEAPYALGLALVGLTPCAPFLPALAKSADADEATVPAMMLFTALATITTLPLAVPLLSANLAVDAGRLARPLLIFIVLPLIFGMLTLAIAPRVAAAVRPLVHAVAILAAILALALSVVIYGEGFLSAVGSYAIAALLFYLIAIAAVSYLLSPGLDRDRRAVLVLAMSTRNVGAALAPLFATSAVDDRTIVMVVLAVPIQILVSFGAAVGLSAGGRVSREPGIGRPGPDT